MAQPKIDRPQVPDGACLSKGSDTATAGVQQPCGTEPADMVAETGVRSVDEVYGVCYPPCVDQQQSVPQSCQYFALPYTMFVSRVVRQLTNEDLKQIQFILADYFQMDEVPNFSNGYDAIYYLNTTNTLNERNVLLLQLLCAAIDNPNLIEYVYKWAEYKGDVLHFYPPVTCSYDWKFSGPLHIRGATFEHYSDRDVEDMLQTVQRMLSSTVTLGGVSGTVSEGQDAKQEPDNPRIEFVKHELSGELNIQPAFSGLCGAENTIPKHYDIAEDVNRITELTRDNKNMAAQIKELTESNEALTHKIDQLHETIRLQENQENVIGKQREEIEVLRAKLSERVTELTKENTNMNVQIKELSESNEGLTHKINQLHETIRLTNHQGSLDEQREEIKVLESRLSERDETIIHLEELMTTGQTTLEELKSEIRKKEKHLQDIAEAAVEPIKCENDELKRKIGILTLSKDALLVRVGKLEDDLEMKDISLSNERNNKAGRFELDSKLQAISKHSLSVRKACGIFDPGSMPIPSSQSENFKHFFTYKVVRIFPQMVRRSGVRVS